MAESPRPYRDDRDRAAMKRLLSAGYAADNGACYVHPGDLDWWLFYKPGRDPLSEVIALWEDESGDLDAWSLISPEYGALDLFVHPRARQPERVGAMLDWTIAKAKPLLRAHEKTHLETMWVAEDDTLWIGLLEARGFTRQGSTMLETEQSLTGPLPEPALPDGFHADFVSGEAMTRARAWASYNSFGSKGIWDNYLANYHSFQKTSVYTPEHDLVIVAPDGQAASICIVWIDTINRIGHFEPVGTHPDFQRQGLGRALMLEGLRRLQSWGMVSATVCHSEQNPAAARLYESAGFRPRTRLLTYSRPLD